MRLRGRNLRITVAGRVLSAVDQPGAAWTVLGWALGACALGHEVTVVEPVPGPLTMAQRRWARLVEQAGGVRPHPLEPDESPPPADLLINLSGVLPASRSDAHRRVYVDLDPGFTQAWALDGVDVGLAVPEVETYDALATVGLAVGGPGCGVPTLGHRWHPLPPPVPLEAFPVAPGPARRPATTVGSWRSYGTAQLDGRPLGQRAHTVRQLLDLPARAPLPIRPALAVDPGEQADLAALQAAGWCWDDPARVARTPDDYRRFVADSRVEIGFAKAGYVTSRSGWLSDRTAAYLASGRPAVVGDTGLGRVLPTGAGLLTYTDTTSAVEALETVLADEAEHRRAARALAETHLDARHVVGRLLELAC